MDWRPSAARVYRALLLAYPAAFRHEYGGQMEEFLLERLQAEPPLRVWRHTLADVALTAPRELWHMLAADLRYAARLFRQSPGFTLVALLTAALGIAASSAVFSLVNAVLLRSLPFGDAERLVYVWKPNVRFGPPVPLELGPEPPDFLVWQRDNRSFPNLAMIIQRWFTVPGGNGAERIGGAFVGGNFFTTMQATPELGRAIGPEDDQPGHDRVAVIAHALWESQFAGDPTVIGKTLELNGKAHQVIGVMPPGFEFPRRNELPPDISNTLRTEVWVPAALTEKQKRSDSIEVIAVGRLDAGVSMARAQQEMTAIEKRLDDARKPGEQGFYALVKPLRDTALGPARPQMWLLAAAVCMVLLISTGNVASLLLARAAGRTHEMSLRSALGADRARLMRQAITESLLLASGGCALGVLGAQAAVWVLVRLNPGDIPRLEEASLDGRVLLFAVGISLAAGLVFGIAPALSASRNDPMSLLREGGNRGMAGGRRRVGDWLMVAEVGLSMILLAGAGLLIKSQWKLQSEGTGFALSTLTMRMQPPPGTSTPERKREVYGGLIAAVRALPGVAAAGITDDLPFSHRESLALFEVQGFANHKDQMADSWLVAPGYLEAMQIPLRAGRPFEDRDIGSGALIANQTFAERYLTGGAAVGKAVKTMNLDGTGQWHTVIGVVGNIRHTKIDEAMRPAIYSAGWPYEAGFLAVRGAGGVTVASAIQATAHRLDPRWEISDIHPMQEAISKAGAARKFQMLLLTAFAGMALFLALVGLYGVIAYSVKQRSAEIGVRMALGASRGAVMAMVLRQGARLAGGGLVLGLTGTLALTRLIAGWLYGVSPVDAATLGMVAGLLFGVSVLACAIPAWRAARIDPVAALRS